MAQCTEKTFIFFIIFKKVLTKTQKWCYKLLLFSDLCN